MMPLSIDPTRRGPATSRRETLALLGGAGSVALGLGFGLGWAPRQARAEADPENVLTEALVLRDPEIPVAGNADGDVTIVEYFDYNCPYCRKLEPELQQVVFDDGKVRLIWKDWPILGPVSVIASKMALASKYQGKYVKAHEALMGVSSKLTESRIKELLSGAGIDIDRLNRDLDSNSKAISEGSLQSSRPSLVGAPVTRVKRPLRTLSNRHGAPSGSTTTSRKRSPHRSRR